jgi:aspartate racemase
MSSSAAGDEKKKPLHIGIVGCSAPGAALCFQTICVEAPPLMGNQSHAHPEISMHTPPLSLYMDALEEDRGEKKGQDWDAVAKLMLASAEKLKKSGADILLSPDNTIHAAFGHDQLDLSFPLPWVHISDVVSAEAARRGFRKVALTGTKWLVGSDVYPTALERVGIEFARPNAAERDEIQSFIMKELTYSVVTPEALECFQRIVRRLKNEEGCDAVVLGCTEIPLLLNDENSPLPVLDSTRIQARAALRRALHLDSP